MVRLRTPPPAEEPRRPVEAVQLFRRRMRACGTCGAASSWSLEDVGPLCVAHLAEHGIVEPDEIPTSGAAWVVPS